MMRKRMLLLAFPATCLASEAWAQDAASFGMQESMMGSMLRSLADKLDLIFASLPALGYGSRDPDSRLYAEITARMAEAPLRRSWAAPHYSPERVLPPRNRTPKALA